MSTRFAAQARLANEEDAQTDARRQPVGLASASLLATYRGIHDLCLFFPHEMANHRVEPPQVFLP